MGLILDTIKIIKCDFKTRLPLYTRAISYQNSIMSHFEMRLSLVKFWVYFFHFVYGLYWEKNFRIKVILIYVLRLYNIYLFQIHFLII